MGGSMAEDTILSIHDAILSNLKKLSVEQSILEELRIYELYDVARAMADVSAQLLDDGLDVCEMLQLLSESIELGEYSVSGDTAPTFRRLVEQNHLYVAKGDRTALVELYITLCRELERAPDERDFLPELDSDETFTYVRNSLSDEAYDVFSQDFDDPKVRYSHNFRDAASAVSSGEVTYCLLPLEERGGVRLHTVSELIFRNDFKINSVIPVFGVDGNVDMKYALVSKSFTVPKREEDDDTYLEIRLGVSIDSPLAELFSAVEHFGMSVYRVNTVTFDTEGERETYLSVVIKSSEGDFTPILTYMTLFLRDFVPVGIYKNLE